MHKPKLLFVEAILYVQNLILAGLRSILFSPVTDPKRILIVRAGSIGDNVCAMPAFAAIRKHFHDAQIHILAKANTGVMLDDLISPDCYDCLINYGSISKIDLLRRIRYEKYDLVIVLPQDMTTLYLEVRAIFFFWLANVKAGFGWEIVTCKFFRKTQNRRLSFEWETDRLLNVLKKNGIDNTDIYSYPLNVTSEDHLFVGELLHEYFPEKTTQKNLVAIIPGAKRAHNRYPLERFEELARWLSQKNYSIVVVGGPDDRERGEVLARNESVVSLCGMLSPLQSTALLMRCTMTISNDTGPMHLSYAAGTPVLGIFSARDFKKKWYPSRGNIAIRDDSASCVVCFSETCQNNICMQAIPVERIKKAFIELERRFAKVDKQPESIETSLVSGVTSKYY